MTRRKYFTLFLLFLLSAANVYSNERADNDSTLPFYSDSIQTEASAPILINTTLIDTTLIDATAQTPNDTLILSDIQPRPAIAFKTNLLFDAATILNAEIEVPLGKRWSIAGEWMFPWWITKDNGNALQVMAGNLEAKYWLGSKEKRDARPVMTGWFAGAYAGGGLYDLQYKDNGYQGEFYIAAGLSAGYAHTINKSGSLRMEYSLGIGYLSTDYRYYEGMEDNEFLVWKYDGSYTWIGPTKAKVSLVWMFHINKKRKNNKRR